MNDLLLLAEIDWNRVLIMGLIGGAVGGLTPGATSWATP